MRTRALLPGLVWNVRDTSQPTPRKPPKADRRRGVGPKSTAEGLAKAGHVLWLHEQHATHREIVDVTGYPISFVRGVLDRGTYLRAVPTPWPPMADAMNSDAAAVSAATT